jgi:hypothetical protein
MENYLGVEFYSFNPCLMVLRAMTRKSKLRKYMVVYMWLCYQHVVTRTKRENKSTRVVQAWEGVASATSSLGPTLTLK